MSQANDLLFRLEEALTKKLDFAPGKVKLSGGGLKQLKKSNILSPTTLKLDSETTATPEKGQKTDTGENGLALVAGMGEINGFPIIFVEVKKEKPFASLIIDRSAINKVAISIAQMARGAATMAEKSNHDYVALIVTGMFFPGKEVRRFRACIYKVASLVGGSLTEKMEAGDGQIYVIS